MCVSMVVGCMGVSMVVGCVCMCGSVYGSWVGVGVSMVVGCVGVEVEWQQRQTLLTAGKRLSDRNFGNFFTY